MLIGCGDKIVNNYTEQPVIENVLANTCYSRYETEWVEVNSETFIGDLKVEWAIGDSTYRFTWYLQNKIPNMSLETTEVLRSHGHMWLSNAISDRELSYVLDQIEGNQWDFKNGDWLPSRDLPPAVVKVIIGANNVIYANGHSYTLGECE